MEIMSMLASWGTSIAMWGGIFVLAGGAGIGFLIYRKRHQMKFPVVELTDLGMGKIGFKTLFGGWVKSKTILFGLVEVGGEPVFTLKDGRKVFYTASTDFHDINGRRGLVVIRKTDDPKVLLPLHKGNIKDELGEDGNAIFDIVGKMKIGKKNLMMEIAPADFRDVSTNIIESANNETMGKFDKYLPYLILAGIVAFAFISLILTIQYNKWSITEAKAILLEAGKLTIESARIVASNAP